MMAKEFAAKGADAAKPSSCGPHARPKPEVPLVPSDKTQARRLVPPRLPCSCGAGIGMIHNATPTSPRGVAKSMAINNAEFR